MRSWSGPLLGMGAGTLLLGSVCATTGGRTAERTTVTVVEAPTPAGPEPGQVEMRGDYVRRACPDEPPARGTTPFDVRGAGIAGKPGAGDSTRTRVADLGTLDVRDGRLYMTGFEHLPWPAEAPATFVDVPRGTSL